MFREISHFMAGISASSPIRGAIKTTIATSTENLVAGDNFSIFVTIQNPFETPLIVHRVSTSFPTEFLDVDQAFKARQYEEALKQLNELKDSAASLGLDTSSIPPFVEPSIWKKLHISKIKLGFLEFDVQPTNSIARDSTSSIVSLDLFGIGQKLDMKKEVAIIKKLKNHLLVIEYHN
jgi:hypothetical protein